MKKKNNRHGVRAAALLLAVMLAVTSGGPTAFAAAFSDVPDGHWAAAAIAAANQAGVMTGTGGGRFSPNGTVSLAQLTTILTRMYWPDEIAASEATGPWYAKNEDVAFNHGLFNVLIDPDAQEQLDFGAPVTRAMMAQMVCNAMLAKGEPNVSDVQGMIRKIPDVSAGNPFAQGIAFCYSRGILQGVDKAGNFSPEATLTRAQTATIYTRIAGAAAPPAAETTTTTAQDLNEWGIPHFRMLEGENVQQMMDRINAVTPPYKAGYLTNGKPISEENIREMAEAILKDMPEGSPWNEDDKYNYVSPACGAYGACGAYACAVSDYIFGEDAPITKHNNSESIKIGDVQRRVTDGSGHVVFIASNPDENTTEIFTGEDGVNFLPQQVRMIKIMDGNANGKIAGIRDGRVIPNGTTGYTISDFVISRY